MGEDLSPVQAGILPNRFPELELLQYAIERFGADLDPSLGNSVEPRLTLNHKPAWVE